jgi:NADPH:quinone reductase-like Zn-dependent oxidoreductase
MKAITQDRYGDADVLTLRDIDRPTPGEGEVLVEVRAAGCGPDVWHTVTGKPYFARPMLGVRKPRTAARGLDLAGVVVGTGPGVMGFAVGDEVYGGSASGSFAELSVSKADMLAPKPAGLSFAEAAAMPVSGCTALQALQRADVAPGMRALVIGAGGGVGGYATQIAAAMGAAVTGVCSAGKADLVRSLGAVDVIDHATEEVDRDGPVYDVVVDTAGNRPISLLRRAMTRTGSLLIVGGDGGGAVTGGFERSLLAGVVSGFVSQRISGVIATVRTDSLEELTRLVEAGQLRPVVGATYPLADTADAVRAIGTHHTTGKLVITLP